jgi:hypothetical protein
MQRFSKFRDSGFQGFRSGGRDRLQAQRGIPLSPSRDWIMTVFQIVSKLEALGCEVVLQGGNAAVIPPAEKLARGKQKKFLQLMKQAAKHSLAVRYWIAEREASRRWDASGHDPQWWRE